MCDHWYVRIWIDTIDEDGDYGYCLVCKHCGVKWSEVN